MPTPTPGARLDIAALDNQGRLTVPVLIANQPAFNAFAQPYIDRYGYVQNGVHVGGGTTGYGLEFNDQDFFRDSGQVGYNLTFGSSIRHDLHVGYQRYTDSEDLVRSSNGWGAITVPGGRVSFQGTPVFFTARFQQQTTGVAAPINSYYQSQSFEVNDTIHWKDLHVQRRPPGEQRHALRPGPARELVNAHRLRAGAREQVQDVRHPLQQDDPAAGWRHLGLQRQGHDLGGFARYNPAASSLPRAASWDRNLIGTFIDAHFDANGVLFGTAAVDSSSGKLFVDDLTPRTVDEFVIGTAKQIKPNWTGRLYGRFREAAHFWEDTNNNARVAFNPPADIPRELYIPDLAARIAQIGSGSTYVIAELDGAYTKYYEVTLESEWRSQKLFVRGSYTWSHYYGNFDQDNSTTDNDVNIFIGSSNIADGAGRQLWDNKDGDLRGDRPHLFKLYGYYMLPWNATVGAFFVAQSGQPWEMWSYEPYLPLVGTTTSDPNRYAEPAGSRRSDAHYQMDLNYTQNIRAWRALYLPARRRTCSTCSTSRPDTASSRRSTTRRSASRGCTSIRGGSRSRRVSSSESSQL